MTCATGQRRLGRGDKLPRVPNRNAPLPLALRTVSGAAIARTLVRRRGWAAAGTALVLGAAAAIGSALDAMTKTTKSSGLRVTTGVKAGGLRVMNHTRALFQIA